ncbi:MAG: hypothetical protein RLZZ08_598 [Pseudomonadota bacterium]|jgi:outer membrane biosynthesis protein TonB
MAARATFATEERLGLGLAVAAHVGLAAFLVLYNPAPLAKPPVPERMTVSLASEVSLTSTSPQPAAEQQAAIAPELSPEPAPPPPEPAVRVEVQPVPPKPVPTRQAVQPSPKPSAAPSPKPSAQPSSKPSPKPSAASSASAAKRPTAPASPAARPGGSRIGSDFLAGAGASERTTGKGAPAATFGPAEQAGLQQAINRQLKPHWTAPQGVDAEQLVTVLSWELNADGTLKGRPVVVSQSGINDSNRAQAPLHAERAIRAVQLSAPFTLPPEYYDKWKRIRTWRFDRRL